MQLAVIIAALAAFTGHQDDLTKSFTEPYLGIEFKYPKSWTQEKTTIPMDSQGRNAKKPKVKKDATRTLFSIPIQGSSNLGELQVVRTEFHAPVDLWQTIQVRESELQKRTVVRQWDQEILGVSMLFSRTEWDDHGTPMAAILGLFYTRTSSKLLLRLTAPTADFDKVNYQFNKVLETLRTIDGKLPQQDDPSIDLAPPPKKLEKVELPPRVIDGGPKAVKASNKPTVEAECVVSTHKILLKAPTGWTVSGAKDNMVELKSEAVASPVQFKLYSTLDSDAPDKALLKLAAGDLDLFSKVNSREDKTPKPNDFGCTVSSVWRVGQSDKGALVVGHAVGTMGDYYLILNYKQTDEAAYKLERKAIDALLKQVIIEPAP